MNRRWMMASAAVVIAFAMAVMALSPKAEPASEGGFGAMALIEAETGELLEGENCDTPLPMASTTKIMTALIVLETCPPDELVEIPEEAVGVEGSSVCLEKGERMTVRDLLYGLMLASGNDAAAALAVHVSGSTEAFAGLMNARAEQLGLCSTHFVNPHGLTAEGHMTTARELCLIAREALKNEVFREIVRTKYHRTESGAYPRTFKNKNALLWDYDGAFGVKTGYTEAAGRCLVFGAEREGMELIGCLLDCGPMFGTAARLMDGAFAKYTKQTVIGAGTRVLDTYIPGGSQKVLELASKSSIITVTEEGTERSFRTETELLPELRAPVMRGETAGVLRVYEAGKLVGETELIAVNSVAADDYGFWFRLLSSLFAA